MRVKGNLLVLVFALVSCVMAIGQMDTIYIKNGGLEGFPKVGEPPSLSWIPCNGGNQDGETKRSPDTHDGLGTKELYWVVTQPYEGDTYVGMVVRDDESWESISQHLKVNHLKANSCYEMSIHLSRSNIYSSMSRREEELPAQYNRACVLAIYGGIGSCTREERLWVSSIIHHQDWREYKVRFTPTKRMTYINIGAYYKTPTPVPYNGNVLIDNISHIVEVDCDKPPEIIAQVDSGPSARAIPDLPSTKSKSAPSKSKTSAMNAKAEKEALKVGQIIKIEQVFFKANKSVFEIKSYEALDQLYSFLQNNPELMVEVGGHTNINCADDFCHKLSTQRAKAVTDYLARKGIQGMRLKFKGYGKSQPLTFGKTEVAQRKNQRVEIKILSLGG